MMTICILTIEHDGSSFEKQHFVPLLVFGDFALWVVSDFSFANRSKRLLFFIRFLSWRYKSNPLEYWAWKIWLSACFEKPPYFYRLFFFLQFFLFTWFRFQFDFLWIFVQSFVYSILRAGAHDMSFSSFLYPLPIGAGYLFLKPSIQLCEQFHFIQFLQSFHSLNLSCSFAAFYLSDFIFYCYSFSILKNEIYHIFSLLHNLSAPPVPICCKQML